MEQFWTWEEKNEFVRNTIVRDDGDNTNTIKCEHEDTKEASANDNEMQKCGILQVIPINLKNKF